jgi:hypothetical protein
MRRVAACRIRAIRRHRANLRLTDGVRSAFARRNVPTSSRVPGATGLQTAPRLRTPQVPGPGSGARDAVLRLGSKRPHRRKSKRDRARPETGEDIPGNPKPKPGLWPLKVLAAGHRRSA